MKNTRRFTAFFLAVVMVILIIPTTNITVSAQDKYLPVAVSFLDGHTYAVFDISLTSKDARIYCESLGGNLMLINSQAKRNFYNRLVKNGTKNSYWVNRGSNDNLVNKNKSSDVVYPDIGFICEWNYIYFPAPRTTSVEDKYLPKMIKFFDGHTLAVYDVSLTSKEMSEYCKGLGGHLILLDSQAKRNFADNLNRNNSTKKTYWANSDSNDNLVNRGKKNDIVYPENGFICEWDYNIYSHLELSNQGNQELSTPSTWAKDDIIRAGTLDLIPLSLDSNYQQNITRAEFCELAIKLYEQRKGTYSPPPVKELAQLYNENQAAFKMAVLGVVKGDNDGNFNLNSEITRQEAAVILSRLIEVLGYTIPTIAPNFKDNNKLASWASDYVGKVQSVGIMGGDDYGNFNPLGRYTREQAIVTIMRVWDLVNEKEYILIPDTGGVYFSSAFTIIYIPKVKAEEIYRAANNRSIKEPFIEYGITAPVVKVIAEKLGISNGWGYVIGLAIVATNQGLDIQRMNKFAEMIEKCNENEFVAIMITTEAFGAPDWNVGLHDSNKLGSTRKGNFKPLDDITDDEWIDFLSRMWITQNIKK